MLVTDKQVSINDLHAQYITCRDVRKKDNLLHEMSIHASRYIVKQTGIESSLALSYSYQALEKAIRFYDEDGNMSFSSYYLMKCKNYIRDIRRTELGTLPYQPFRDDTPLFMVGDDAFHLLQDSTDLEKEAIMREISRSSEFSKKEIVAINKIMDGYKVNLSDSTKFKLQNYI